MAARDLQPSHPGAGQRVLLALIRFYRRRLSGRGPLRRVRCTFARTESCSAYGLRVAAEAGSLGRALALILGRLRRCGRAGLYLSPQPGGPDLLWGELYDDLARPTATAQGLRRDLERPPARSALLRAAALVQVHRGEAASAADYLSLARREHDPPARLLVRPAAALGGAARRRLRLRLGMLLLLGVAQTLLLPGWFVLGGAAALLLATGAALAGHAHLRRRIEALDGAARFAPSWIPAGQNGDIPNS